ncbi:MAG: ParB/RepB/Spo0J family partition protein [Sulfurovum sp.]|nr:ParB/RepB/Spo0J family partition protein [Sulfurovum sp.]
MALGKGLGAILTEVEEAYEKDLADIDSFELESEGIRVEMLAVDSISPNPFQPRKFFDKQALKELGDSIVQNGLLQPIVVIERGDGYLLVVGERRLKAHKLVGLDTIKAVIADTTMDDFKLRELALLENIQRENLNAIELAHAYAELIDVHDITHAELSKIVHKSRSQITNTMRLLSLTPYAQEKVVSGKVTQGHAKVLGGLDEKKQKVIIDSIVGQKLSVRETENIVKKYKENTPKTLASKKELSKELSKILPFSYTLKEKSIEIHFTDDKDRDKFLTFLKKIKN